MLKFVIKGKIQTFQILNKLRSRKSNPASVFKIIQTLQDFENIFKTLQDLKDFENEAVRFFPMPNILQCFENIFKTLQDLKDFETRPGDFPEPKIFE